MLEDDDHAKLVKFGFVKPSAVNAADSLADERTEAVGHEVGNGQPGRGWKEP